VPEGYPDAVHTLLRNGLLILIVIALVGVSVSLGSSSLGTVEKVALAAGGLLIASTVQRVLTIGRPQR
jgi:hypothetical protein